MTRSTHWWKRVTAVFLLVGVSACAATFSNHGYAPTDDELENVIVGVDSRSSVEESVGRPSSTGMLRDDGWYYTSRRIRHFAYKEDEVIDRQLVAISFNKGGTVTNIERFTLEDGRVVALNRRVTASGIKGISFIRQMLGNFGQFSLEDQLNN